MPYRTSRALVLTLVLLIAAATLATSAQALPNAAPATVSGWSSFWAQVEVLWQRLSDSAEEPTAQAGPSSGTSGGAPPEFGSILDPEG